MPTKHPIDQYRIRKVPTKFNWVDHRLVRDRHIEYCSHSASTLYLFLVTVSDAQGLSYYSDASLMQRLSMDNRALLAARQNLIRLNLVAYKKPLYQVLALDMPAHSTSLPEGPMSIGSILRAIAGGAS